MRSHSTTVSWFRDEGQSDAKDWACGHRCLRFLFRWSCVLVILAMGCNKAPSQTPDPVAAPLENALSYLTIPTYDGSGHHPGTGLDTGWRSVPTRMGSKENASIVGSDDGERGKCRLGL